jgi:DNA modification methylase
VSNYQIIQADVLAGLAQLPSESVNCVVTSPPYWGLRDYGTAEQIGLEKTPQEYVDRLVSVFREVKRVLRADGTLWLNIGDTYQNKSLAGVPWSVALALKSDGWLLRQEIIWHKSNAMPDPAPDRPGRDHEQVFLFSKTDRYAYDADAVREPHVKLRKFAGKQAKVKQHNDTPWMNNQYAAGACGYGQHPLGKGRRSVWTIAKQAFAGAHFATFPEKLVEPCILAGCPAGGTVLDPFCGSGTTGVVALRHGRQFIGLEVNPEYVQLAHKRITDSLPAERLAA